MAVVVACTVVNALTVVTCAHKSKFRQAQEHIVLQSGGGIEVRACSAATTSCALLSCANNSDDTPATGAKTPCNTAVTVSLSRSQWQPTSTEVETVGRDGMQQESAAHHGHHGDLYCASHRSSTVCQRSARVCEGCSQAKVERKRDSLPRCESFMQVIGGHAFVLIQCLRSWLRDQLLEQL